MDAVLLDHHLKLTAFGVLRLYQEVWVVQHFSHAAASHLSSEQTSKHLTALLVR